MRGILSATTVAAALAVLLVAQPASGDAFVDFGVASTQIDARVAAPGGATSTRSDDVGLHLGVGVRKAVNDRSDIGVRLEIDSVDSEQLLALRAFDYRRHRSDRLAFNYFAGAARLSLGTPAWGYYLGFGVQIKEITRDFDLGVDLRIGDKLARDNVLDSDFQGGSPDNFYDLTGISIYLSRRFGGQD